MSLLSITKFLVLMAFGVLTLAKNVAPPSPRRGQASKALPVLRSDIAPSFKVTGGSKRGLDKSSPRDPKAAVVPKEHVFYNNYQANFSRTDPEFLAALGIRSASSLQRRDSNLVKRAPGSKPGDPVFKIPSCLGCIEARDGQKVTLDTLSTDYLVNQILLKGSQIQDKCVFYTSVPNPALCVLLGDCVEYNDRRNLGGADRHHGLSKIATDWSCLNNKVTIWNFYSGESDVTGSTDVRTQRNYWEVYTPNSWLNFLEREGNQFKYFENMSRAMARVCRGTVYVMSMRPKQMSKYGFIWGTVEYVELLSRHTAGRAGYPTDLISIDAANPSNQYYLDWATQEVTSQLTKRDPNYLEFDESLEKRETCSSNVDYEPADEDWFG